MKPLWAGLRARRVAYVASLLGLPAGLPVVVLLSRWLAAPLYFVIPMAAAMAVYVAMGRRLIRWPCPRCGQSFSVRRGAGGGTHHPAPPRVRALRPAVRGVRVVTGNSASSRERARPRTRDTGDARFDLLRASVLLFVGVGVAIALAFCLWVTVVYLVAGPAPFAENGSSYGRVALSYLSCGVAGGVVVGLLRPFIHNARGAALIGFAAAVPCVVAFRIAVRGAGGWGFEDLLDIVVLSLVLGPMAGYRLWRMAGG